MERYKLKSKHKTKFLIILLLANNLYAISPKSIFKPFFILHGSNTKEDITMAKSIKADGIEIDIHITKDNILILIHNPTLIIDDIEQKTCDLTYQQIKKVIPDLLRLEDVLLSIDNLKLIIHLHSWFSNIPNYNERIVNKTIETLKEYAVYSFISFDLKQLKMIKNGYIKLSEKTGQLQYVNIGYCTDYNDGIYSVDLNKKIGLNELLCRADNNNINQLVLGIENIKSNLDVEILTPFKIPINIIYYLKHNIKVIFFDDILEFRMLKCLRYSA